MGKDPEYLYEHGICDSDSCGIYIPSEKQNISK